MSENYFLIESKLGKSYVSKIKNEEGLSFEIEEIDGDDVLVSIGSLEDRKFIVLDDPIVMVPRRTPDGRTETVSVRISESPTGSSCVAIATDVIAEINLIDSKSSFVTGLKAAKAGLYAGGNEEDIENSSKLIHKFSKR